MNQIQNLMKTPKEDNGKNMPSIDIRTENAVHQADLLYLPYDNGFKYALIVADAGTKLIDGEPLKNKTARTVVDAFRRIYSRNILKIPKRIELDPGTEFQGEVIRFFENNNVFIRVGKVGRHRQQALVERKNQLISVLIFQRQLEQELITGETDTQWVEDFPLYIQQLNDSAKRKKWYRMKDPNKYGDPVCQGNSCELIPEGTAVRVQLDNPFDIPTEKTLPGKFRSVDIRWHPETRYITRIVIYPEKPPMYLLDGDSASDGVDLSAAYTKNQLQIIPENELSPRMTSLRGPPPQKWRIENILDKRKNRNIIEYLVKWANGQQTWEPRANLMRDVPKLINRFEKRLKK